MNKRQKEIIQAQLDAEKKVLKQLEKQYQKALDEINEKILLLQSKTVYDSDGFGRNEQVPLSKLPQSRIYQIEHQKALKGQIEGIIEKLHSDEYETIQQYLEDSYVDAFVGTAYDLAGQGIPLIMPIDQAAAVRAIKTDSKISEGLYAALGVDTKNLKKAIAQEATRGVASGLTYSDIARNIQNVSNVPISNAKRIAKTEGHRIQQASTMDAQKAAKAKGADVVKQWDASLDGRTRDTHRRLDGQIRDVDDPFEMDGKSAMFPGDFGNPAEDCNCRCASLTRAKWGLDEDELKTLQDRAEYFGLDKTEDFDDFKKKYLKATEETEKQFGVMYGEAAMDVDFDFINSNEYKAKFSKVTDNQKVNDKVLDVSKTILKHCDGTEHEDMYLISMEGKVISKVTDSVSKLGVNYSDEFKAALTSIAENNTPVIALHNHPHGTPPSPDDFRKAFENKYKIGVAVGHNGQVYVYSNDSVEITLEMADQMADDIEFLYRMGWDIDRASQMVYDEYGLNYTF